VIEYQLDTDHVIPAKASIQEFQRLFAISSIIRFYKVSENVILIRLQDVLYKLVRLPK